MCAAGLRDQAGSGGGVKEVILESDSPRGSVTVYCQDCGAGWGERGAYIINRWFFADRPVECPECGSEDWEDIESTFRPEVSA